MIQISPEQKIYTQIRKICDELGYSVYDYQADSQAEFPFVILGEQFSQPFREHKDGRSKQVQTTIHVWHNDWRKRGTVSQIMREIELKVIDRFGVPAENINMQIIADDTTGSNLWHGILETDIKI